MVHRIFVPSVCAVLIITAPISAQPTNTNRAKLLEPFKPLNSKLSDSTVRIQSNDSDVALGTIVSTDGLILTKASELRGNVTVVLKDGSAYDVEIVSVHKDSDLALLKLDLKKAGLPALKPVKFVDSKKATTGNWLIASSPRSEPVAVGIVSVPTRDLQGDDRDNVLNFNRGIIGITPEDSEDPKGAKITRFSKDSAGEAAGLKVGDVIVAIDDRPVTNSQSLLTVLSDYRREETIRILVQRGKEKKEFDVTLARRVLDKDRDRGEIMNGYGSTLSGRRQGFKTILQSDMVVQARDCGGPVCDLDGNVLGISIARAGRVETWVLPSEVIRPVLDDMKSGKFPPPPHLKKAAVKAEGM